MFSGEHNVTMDDKGRVFVPARFRDDLGPNLMMWRGMAGQIMMYPKPTWQKMADALSQQATSQHVREVRWMVFSATEEEPDRQGRIVIPQSLRKHAELGSDIVVVGLDDHVEVWSEARWEALTARFLTSAGDIADVLAELGVKL